MKETNSRFIEVEAAEVLQALGIKLAKKEYVEMFVVRESDGMLLIGTSDDELEE